MSQDTPRNDVDPDDRLLDFDSEASNSALDKKESDITLRSTEPDSAVGGEDPEIFFNRQEPDITPVQPDIAPVQPATQPDARALPLHAPPVQPFVWYTSDPVVHKSARLKNISIALLLLASIGALAWSGRLLMAMRRDAGASGAQIQNASQPTPTPTPTPTVPPEAPANVLPPAPDPQPPATDVPARSEPRVPAQTATPSKPATVIATPSEPATATVTPSKAPRPNAPDAPRAARPAPQAERLPVNAAPNAAGGLFAITRPVGAQVFVDNKLIGTTPLFMSQLSSGSHEVRLELPGFKTHSSSIQVEPNSRFRLAVQLEETP